MKNGQGMAIPGSQDIATQETHDIAGLAAVMRAKTEVQAAVLVARSIPRDENQVLECLQKAVARPRFAEACYYKFPRGNAEVVGPSINLAREFARLWGNIAYGFIIEEDTEDSRKIRAYAWDLQTNVRRESPAEFKKLHMRKNQRTGVTEWVKPDERDLRELTERHAAIQMRNCILSLAPRDFVDDLVDAAMKSLHIKQKDIAKEQQKMVKAFSAYKVDEAKLEKYLGHAIGDTTAEELAEMRGIYNSIKDGNSKPSEYFGDKDEKKPEAPKGEISADMFGTDGPPEDSKAKAQAQQKLAEENGRYYGMLQANIKRFATKQAYVDTCNTALKFGDDLEKKREFLRKVLTDIGLDPDTGEEIKK